MNNIVIPWLIIVAGIFTLFVVYVLAVVLLRVVKQITETNKQLLIVVAGKEVKPEALRALAASNKLPKGKLKGIATNKEEKKASPNTDYTLTVGGNHVL